MVGALGQVRKQLSTANELAEGDAIGVEHSASAYKWNDLVATTVNNSGAHQLQIIDIDNDVSIPLKSQRWYC